MQGPSHSSAFQPANQRVQQNWNMQQQQQQPMYNVSRQSGIAAQHPHLQQMLSGPPMNANTYMQMPSSGTMQNSNMLPNSQDVFTQQHAQYYQPQYGMGQQGNAWSMQPNYYHGNYSNMNSAGYGMNMAGQYQWQQMGYGPHNPMMNAGSSAAGPYWNPNCNMVPNTQYNSQMMFGFDQHMNSSGTTNLQSNLQPQNVVIHGDASMPTGVKERTDNTLEDPSVVFKFPPNASAAIPEPSTTNDDKSQNISAPTEKEGTRFMPDVVPHDSTEMQSDITSDKKLPNLPLRSATDDAEAVVDDIDTLDPSIRKILCSVPQDETPKVSKVFQNAGAEITAVQNRDEMAACASRHIGAHSDGREQSKVDKAQSKSLLRRYMNIDPKILTSYGAASSIGEMEQQQKEQDASRIQRHPQPIGESEQKIRRGNSVRLHQLVGNETDMDQNVRYVLSILIQPSAT